MDYNNSLEPGDSVFWPTADTEDNLHRKARESALDWLIVEPEIQGTLFSPEQMA
jgi:hypothetical protein